jgi:hypothetical protein
MKTGIRAKFEQQASAGRAPLSRNSRRQYWAHLMAFHRFVGRPAAQWRGADLSAWMHRLERERYSISSRRQMLCAIVWAFKHVLEVDPGNLDLPQLPREPRRVVGVVPKLVSIDAGPNLWIGAHKAQMDFLKTADREPINLPHAGARFNDPDLESFRQRVIGLIALGYNVPPYVLESIDEEMKGANS